MKRPVIYISSKGDMRQYRIHSNDSANIRISDSDGWRFGATMTERVNFALSEVDTKRRQAIKKAIGEIGLKFVSNFAKAHSLSDVEQLIIVNAWTVIFAGRNAGSTPTTAPKASRHFMDDLMVTVISKTLRRKVETVPAEEPVGAVFF